MNAKTATRLKTEALNQDVPQTRDEANEAVAEIGRLQRDRTRIEADMNADLASVRAQYEGKAKPLGEQITQLTRGVHVWAEANRDALTGNGRTKTVKLASGEISWRMRPPSVAVRGMAAVIEALKALKLKRFIRVREELDKEAVLADPDAVGSVKGISITQREDFVIKPDATELEEVQ